jgi:hypothetical protein
MKSTLLFFILGLSVLSCNRSHSTQSDKTEIEFNQILADELRTMAVLDQEAANIQQGEYLKWSKERWSNFKDSVFTSHGLRLKEIFNQFGYPGFSLVGERGEHNFWLMVQHYDSDPEFQLAILEKLKVEVDHKNANAQNFGYLMDRVKLNTDELQVFGTQVRYNSFGQAYPKPLADSVNVNTRRAEIGMEALEEYLNVMTQFNFDMNKSYLNSIGINEPKFYEVKK